MTRSAAARLIGCLSVPLLGLLTREGCPQEGATNVALRKAISSSSMGGLAYRGLVDGVVDSDGTGCFATGNDAEYPKKVVIDLGGVYLIDQVVVYSSANGNTKKVDVYASRDGVSYRQLREPYVFPKGVPQRMSARLPALEARFVKLAFLDTYGGGLGGDNTMYLREVEVMGRPVGASGQPKARPEAPATPPRAARLFRRYALQEGRTLRLLVIGDEMAAGREGGPGLGSAVADRLRQRFSLAEVEVVDACRPGLSARTALAAGIPPDADPDLVLVAVGTAESLSPDPDGFRGAVARLLARLLDDTHALVVVVIPPRIPRLAELGRFEELGTADTAEVAWALAALGAGGEVCLVDAEAALKQSGLRPDVAYADNLSLSDAGREALAGAILGLFQ